MDSSFFIYVLRSFPAVGNEVSMYSTVITAMLDGIRAVTVRVEADISAGLPAFEMVGCLSSEVREAKERVRTALHNCGIVLPAKRITINLSPANIRKSGTGFDLPIAIALMAAMGQLASESCQDVLFLGELNLSGGILPIRGVLPVVSDKLADNMHTFVIPKDNLREAKLVKGARVYGFSSLPEVIAYLKGEDYESQALQKPSAAKIRKTADFSDINGQLFLKRAAEIAASGMHNMLIVGPPGAGKTMVSERIASILPPLTEEEKMELSKIYSICGLLSGADTLLSERPFRSPHHTVSPAGLAGGGADLRPGEISLAHHGVLFLDELPEFAKSTLEILRQPLEDKTIRITRVRGSVTYPSDFLLLASMNPCNCGYYPDMQKCRCTPASIKRYFGHLSQPLLDRMDICVQAPGVSYMELTGRGTNESSETVRKRVCACHEIQIKRFQNEDFCHNSRIPPVRLNEYCRLGEKEQQYMENMYKKMSLTARTYHKVLRVARTIADLDGSENIRLKDLTEAVCYRELNHQFTGGGE